MKLSYFFKSVCTWSFWRHALFSISALAQMLAIVGALYLLMEILDFLNIYVRTEYSKYAIFPLFLFAVIVVIATRRPLSRVTYRFPKKDFTIEVRIGDLFEGSADVIVSTNTTFDTNMANGLIDSGSLQGQVATRFFNSNTDDIDSQLTRDLAAIPSKDRADAPGKTAEYPIGTTARVKSHGRTFYFVAMSRLSADGTAGASTREVEDALEALWDYIGKHGEVKPLAIPIMGTGRGRISSPRKKMVERIAQSFADGSKGRIFAPKLSIVVRPEDAENFEVNLYEIRDYLVHSLHP